MRGMKLFKLKWVGLSGFIFAALFLVFYPRTAAADQDVTPPVIEKIEWRLPEKDIFDVGDYVTLHIEYSDEDTLNYVSTWLDGPYNKTIYSSGSGYPIQVVKDKDGKIHSSYDVNFTFNSSNPRGEWSLGYLTLYDRAGNYTSVDISELERFDLTENSLDFGFKGLDYNKSYNHEVVPIFNGSATLNGLDFKSGQSVTTEGSYSLYITEPNGEHTTVPFTIDKTDPIISGVTHNAIYNKNVTLSYKDGAGYIGYGYSYVDLGQNNNISLSYDGKYYFKVVDDAGNKTEANFIIDKTAPTITTKLSYSKPTNKEITINLSSKDQVGRNRVNNETTGVAEIIKPDGKVVKGSSTEYKVSKNGSYTFKVKDNAGNISSSTVKVTNIDKTAPKVESSLSTTKLTNKDVDIKITSSDSSYIENITLPDKKTVKNGIAKYKATKNGSYTFIVKDKAGNTTSKTVKVSNIDKSAPGKPSVNKVTTKSKTVTGKAEKNATVYVYKGSKQLSKATVNSKGAYTVKIAAQKKNTKLSVYVKDKAENKSKSVSVTVK